MKKGWTIGVLTILLAVTIFAYQDVETFKHIICKTITFGNAAKIYTPHTDSTVVTGTYGVVRGDIVVQGNDVRYGSGAMISNSADSLIFQDATENLLFCFSPNAITLKSNSGVAVLNYSGIGIQLGAVVSSFTESGDSVCSIVIGGTTYKIRP